MRCRIDCTCKRHQNFGHGHKQSEQTKQKISEGLALARKPSWNKALRSCKHCSKEFFPSRKTQVFCSKSCMWAHPFSTETRLKLSQYRITKLQNGAHLQWFEYELSTGKKIKIQGSWEKRLADELTTRKVEFDRITILFAKTHRYTPDFYIPSLGIWIEVKGCMYEKDKYKMLTVLQEHPHMDIRILDKRNIWQIPNNLKSLPKFADEWSMSDIDFSKFKKRF